MKALVRATPPRLGPSTDSHRQRAQDIPRQLMHDTGETASKANPVAKKPMRSPQSEPERTRPEPAAPRNQPGTGSREGAQRRRSHPGLVPSKPREREPAIPTRGGTQGTTHMNPAPPVTSNRFSKTDGSDIIRALRQQS